MLYLLRLGKLWPMTRRLVLGHEYEYAGVRVPTVDQCAREDGMYIRTLSIARHAFRCVDLLLR